MASSKLKDSFRKSIVVATPEEIVRQKLLKMMTEKLGYPKQLLVIEKQLSELPHLQGESFIPNRRVDILCYGKDIHPEHSLYPLLLIECKEGKVKKAAEAQALGYNYHINALFVAVAGLDEVCLIHPQKLSFLPTYTQLMERVCKVK